MIVCTDDIKIKNVVESYGGEALLTSKKHKNGTERIAEVAKKFKNAKLFVDIQGDQPLIDPQSIDLTIKFHLKNPQTDIVLPSMILKKYEIDNKSLVKNIFSENGRIVYFSRERVPYNYKNIKNVKYFKNLSIISFKPKALKDFSLFRQGSLEKIEGIELMRSLENGQFIGTFIVKGSDFAVDVNADLMRAIDLMPKDKIRKLY